MSLCSSASRHQLLSALKWASLAMQSLLKHVSGTNFAHQGGGGRFTDLEQEGAEPGFLTIGVGS